MLLLVSVHPSRAADLLSPGIISFSPGIPVHVYRDSFGNDCTRIVAPQGRLTLSTRFDVADSGLPDEVNWSARQHPVEYLPDDTMVYLLGQPVLRNRPAERCRLVDVRPGRAGLGAGAGDLRFRAPPYPVRLQAGPPDPHRG